MPKLGVASAVAVVVCLVGQFSAAQSRISSERSGRMNKSDPDEIIQRHHWFRRGRQGVQGKSAAALRLDAYRQIVMRRNAINTSATSAAQTAGTSSASGQIWNQLGPTPILSNPSGSTTADYDYGPVIGRVTSLFVDTSDATGNTVYIGGATGGLWRSTNAATNAPTSVTWSPLLDTQATLSVGAVGVQPGNSNLIIVGTGEPDFSIDSYYALGFLRSTDNGASWTLISSANSGAGGFTMDLEGIAFSSVVFSTDNPNLVVAGAGASGVGFANRLETVTDERFGAFYSTDAGQSWTRSAFVDGVTPVKPWSVSSIVYNPLQHLFYATVGFQGIYSSSDGATWTRLTSQPGSGLSISNCPAYFSTTCPIFRGALSIRPGADEMYVWYVDLNSKDQGIYKTTDGGQTWLPLNESGITNCGDTDGCGTEQGFFNLVLSAVPQSNGGTDLYAGAVNLFKCSLSSANPTCSTSPFVNLTHVYGCSPIGSLAHVHPDQHAIAFVSGNSQIIYFGNDGGVYRTLDSAALSGGVCGTTPNPFDDLNATMGSMAQFVWLSQDPTNQTNLLGGTQDNGSPARITAAQGWPEVNFGDGGYNAINPSLPSEWFTAHTDVSIQRCTLGTSCTPGNFSSVVTNATVGGDVGPFYTPYLLDPQALGEMLVGTCRVWRGPSNGSAGWIALSNNLDTASATTCPSGAQNQIQTVAAAGPKTSNGSQVIWVGTSNGNIWRTLNADGGPSTWSSSFTTPYLTPVSSIAIDPRDSTGKTIYFTTQGFFGGQIGVIGSNAITGATGDLPNIPANSLIFDSEFPNIMYVGTDIGVFQSVNSGANWTEVGAGSLPSAPVTHLEVFQGSGVKTLRAATYGRGIWETNLPTGSIPLVSFSSYMLTFAAQPIGTTSTPLALTLSNIGSAALNVTSLTVAGSEFAQTNNCPATLSAAGSCTISITFTPSASGTHMGTLTLTDNAYDSPEIVQLVGNIPIPAIKLIDSVLSFPGVAVGALFGPTSTLVFSSGTAPLTISNISATGDFSETDDCVGTLPTGQSCTIRVSFRPTAPGSRQGAILITDNASGSPQSISLTGVGVAELVVSTDVLNFGDVLVGQSRTLPLTLSNYTAASIGINQLALGGGLNPGDFSQTNNCGSSVASQASCVINIVFTPSGGINAWTNLTVVDTNGNTVGALVQGFDTDFLLTSGTSPSTLTVTAGQTANFTVFLGGEGAFNGSVSLACKGGPQGSACTATPASVALTIANPSASITVSVSTAAPATATIVGFAPAEGQAHLLKFGLASLIASLVVFFFVRQGLGPGISIRKATLLLLAFGIILLAMSCGGGGGSGSGSNSSPGQQGPTSYTITVTGTSGSLTSSATLTLIVNP